ncbi:MAG: hypothetical protein R3F34_20560 [Planctomycetota bacterium]
MVRALVERLPIMVTPRWVDVAAQPVAVEDLLALLVEAGDVDLDGSHVFEIGGADRVTYGDLMREYARQRGLSRDDPRPRPDAETLESVARTRHAALRAGSVAP